MTINRPEVLSELAARHNAYENALTGNDVAALDSMLWSPWPATGIERQIRKVEITSFGDSAGIIELEYVKTADPAQIGCESQFWIRFDDGWKIVSLHASQLAGPHAYLDAASARIGLPVAPSMRAEVSENLNRLGAIADFLMQFPLGQDVEAASVFHPEQ